MSKLGHHKRHAKHRAYVRHGILLDASALKGMAKRARAAMEAGNSVRLTRTRAAVLIEWEGKEIGVVYTRQMGGAIVTVLPPDAYQIQELKSGRRAELTLAPAGHHAQPGDRQAQPEIERQSG